MRDVIVAIALEGDFTAAHADGDNSLVVATDTMKNTAFAFARDHLDGSIEEYGRALAEHFLEFDQVDRATVNVREHALATDRGRRHAGPRCLPARRRRHPRIATVAASRGETTVEAGVEDLVAMKTTRSGVQRLPARPLHDPAGDRRSADGHEDHRHLAIRIARPRLRSPRSRASRRPCSRSSPTTTVPRSRRPSGSWPRRCSNDTTPLRRSGWSCQISTTGSPT